MNHQYIRTAILGLCLITPLSIVTAHSAHHEQELVVATDAGNINFHFTKLVKSNLTSHSIHQIHQKDNILELTDGSQWNVTKPDVIRGWEKNEHLVLTQNQATFSTYRFALANPELKLAIPVSLIREPIPSKDKCLFIKDIDKANDLVTLNDHGRWIIHSSDIRALNKMTENHRIIIGVNSGEDHDRCPYILIDASNNSYVRARLI